MRVTNLKMYELQFQRGTNRIDLNQSDAFVEKRVSKADVPGGRKKLPDIQVGRGNL